MTEQLIQDSISIAVFMGAINMPEDDVYRAHLLFPKEIAPPIMFVDRSRKWASERKEYRVALTDADNLQYHTSWDWLIPVVEKIYRIIDEMKNKYPESKPLYDLTGWRAWSYQRFQLDVNIDLVFKRIINFIKWYNQNK